MEKHIIAVHLLNVFSEVSQNDWNLQFIENIFCKKYFHANWTEMFHKLQITFSLKISVNIFPDIEEMFIWKWSLIKNRSFFEHCRCSYTITFLLILVWALAVSTPVHSQFLLKSLFQRTCDMFDLFQMYAFRMFGGWFEKKSRKH